MAINVHAHITAEHDIDERVAFYQHPDITHTVLFGHDDQAQAATEKYPDSIIAFGIIHHPTPTTPETIHQFVDRGFRGVKIICLRRPYDDVELFPMYEAIAEAKLPILFHTGYVTSERRDPTLAQTPESMLFMRPGMLDTIARAFPDLVMIGAHLGSPWWMEACVLMWKHKNIYFDLSGGTIRRRTAAQLRDLFRWTAGDFLSKEGDQLHPEIFSKVVFGSDNRVPDDFLQFYYKLCDVVEADDATRQKVMTGNAAKILGLDVQ